MGLIKKFKSGVFTTVSTLTTMGMVKFSKDRLIIIIGDEVVYKGVDYDKFKGTGKARSIRITSDSENGEMRAMIDWVLKHEGAI